MANKKRKTPELIDNGVDQLIKCVDKLNHMTTEEFATFTAETMLRMHALQVFKSAIDLSKVGAINEAIN